MVVGSVINITTKQCMSGHVWIVWMYVKCIISNSVPVSENCQLRCKDQHLLAPVASSPDITQYDLFDWLILFT